MAHDQRKLVAVLAADVVGYSRLMGRDESGTLARVREHQRECLEPTLARYGGRLVKLMGDGALAEFSSAVDALSAAIEFQQAIADSNRNRSETERIVFRIGLHLGDVIVEGDDLYGDGVNIAARLESEAPAGGILVSRAVHESVTGRLKTTFDDLGGLTLKNIERPIQAFSVKWEPCDWQQSPSPTPGPLHEQGQPLSTVRLALPDKPSIAVLPFQNMSSDPEQEYFADGIVEDIITALSHFNFLFVIARNSSFAYKGRSPDIRQVGRELGVRYVLEGSVRKAASKVRITSQLINSENGAHIWADRIDGALENIFELQDQVTENVVGAIAPQLERAEIERAKQKPTDSLDAYDHYLRGMTNLHRGTRESIDEALARFNRALQLDPNFASAHAMAAWCYFWRKVNGWMTDRPREIAEGARLARRAVELGGDDAVALTRGGHALGHLAGDVDGGIALIDRALALNPNLASAWFLGGYLRVCNGEPDGATGYFERAMRLSPLDPEMYRMQAGMAMAHLFAGRFDTASSWAEKAFRQLPSFLGLVGVMAASHALAGRTDEAQRAISHLRQLDPTLRISSLGDWLPIRRPKDLATFADGLRRAGLQE
jgi:TolB-like protein/class 3 adenylate cyclase/Tfp pilus assembly protein PilF